MIEIRYDGTIWFATQKTFYSREEAEKKAEILREKYPFIDKCRVVARKEKEKD